MTLLDFFLLCFVMGFALSALSFLVSGFHLPHLHVHSHSVSRGCWKSGTSAINFGTATTFLAWFGGTGYLLERLWPASILTVLVCASLSGLLGAALVFWFVVYVLARHEKDLNPDDFNLCGVLGRVSCSVRVGGTGEMIFSQQGQRRAIPIRSENGHTLPRGVEVVVMRYERGIAYVRPWEDGQFEL